MSSMCYLFFGYNVLRTDTTSLVFLYVLLFIFAYFIIKTTGFYFRLLVISAVLFRLLFLFAVPNLSQDFYRFIWDGRMLFEGFNPYLYTPNSFILNGQFPVFQAQELYNGMGSLSASHFSNYPPLNQLCFFIAAICSGKSILGSITVLRLIIITADIGTLYFGKKLLEHLKLPSYRIFWYILNPFIIIELTGNLHFEGVMIFFLVWSLYLLHLTKWKWAAITLACSISVKLIPLMLLPLYYGWFRKPDKKGAHAHHMVQSRNQSIATHEIITTKKIHNDVFRLLSFYSIMGITVLLFFLPFFTMEFINNYATTVGLWFGKFEFNASIYYVAREVGYFIKGYNQIATIGKILPGISLLIILALSLLNTNNTIPKLTTSMLFAFACYLFLSTTVHPWYIATLVLLSVFTTYKFSFVWSVVIIISYVAYSNKAYTENLWLVGLEYLIVFSIFIWEIFILKSSPHKENQLM